MSDYRDSSLPIKARVTDLMAQMTLEEKVGQMTQLPANFEENLDKLELWHVGSFLHCTGQKAQNMQKRAEKTRLGIPLLFGIDAIHGHCFEEFSTVFPTQLALSCSWNTALAEDVARVTATEVRACGLHWTFSPVLCVGRDTRWGRISETFGEDPWLIGEMAKAMIIGYQGETLNADDTIMACAKHYVGYGEALGGRDAYEANISKRKLLTYFLPPFEKAVKEAKVETFMAGYQSIDGVPCSADTWLMRELPKEQWGLEGFIVTDWDNIGALHEKQFVAADYSEAAKMGITAGNDMIMTTPSFYKTCLELVQSGQLDMALIDDAVARILRCKFKLGLFDERRYTDLSQKEAVVGSDDHWNRALEASRQGLTLLTNHTLASGEKALPLPLAGGEDHPCKVYLVGPTAHNVKAQLGDWSFGSYQATATNSEMHQQDTITVLQGLKAEFEKKQLAGQTVELTYRAAVHCADLDINEIEQAKAEAEQADIIVACIGDTLSQQGEFHDRSDLSLGGHQQALLETLKATGKPFVVVYIASKPLAINWVKENADAVLCAFNPGSKGGQAIAEVLTGELNPSGRLTISFPHSAGQLPVYYNRYPGWHSVLSDQFPGQERYLDAPSEPVFGFGEGLSYTQFEYSELKILTPELNAEQPLELEITVANTGEREGIEVAQLYIRDLYSSVTTPVKNLRAYQRIKLAAGEAQTLHFTLDYWELALISQQLEKVVEPGEFEVMVGHSSKDEDLLKARFNVQA